MASAHTEGQAGQEPTQNITAEAGEPMETDEGGVTAAADAGGDGGAKEQGQGQEGSHEKSEGAIRFEQVDFERLQDVPK